MVTFKYILSLVCLGIGLGCINGYVKASEPSIYQMMLTPSPLGKDRILVLCLLKKNDGEKFKEFYGSVKWDEFSERDLVLVEVSENILGSVFGDSRKGARHHDYGDMLRRKADCKDELEFVLIGKDTSVKARWKNDFTQEDLFNRIDAMPMRRFEMLQQRKN